MSAIYSVLAGAQAPGGLIQVFWAGVGTTAAPDATLYRWGVAGADLNGISGGSVYHVAPVAGVKTWIATGATVANAWGG